MGFGGGGGLDIAVDAVWLAWAQATAITLVEVATEAIRDLEAIQASLPARVKESQSGLTTLASDVDTAVSSASKMLQDIDRTTAGAGVASGRGRFRH